MRYDSSDASQLNNVAVSGICDEEKKTVCIYFRSNQSSVDKKKQKLSGG